MEEKNKKTALLKNVDILYAILLAIALVILPILLIGTYWNHIYLFLTIFGAFVLYFFILRCLAYIAKKEKYSAEFTMLSEYAIVYLGALALLGIISIDINVQDANDKMSQSYINRLERDINHKIDWSLNYYSIWDDSLKFGEMHPNEIISWFKETKKFLSQDFKKEKWTEFIDSNKMYLESEIQSDIKRTLNLMKEYKTEKVEKNLISSETLKNVWGAIQYISFFAIALLLALKLNLLSIQNNSYFDLKTIE